MLTLFEELLVLSIHQDKGTFLGWAVDQLKVGLNGAVLDELALMGKIQTDGNHRLSLLESNPTDDAFLDETLIMLKESEKNRKFGYWLSTLNQKPENFRKLITERLIQKGIVIQEEDHLTWVTPTPLQPDLHVTSKYWLTNHLRGIVLGQGDVEKRDIALLSLVRACDLLDLIFLKDERRFASRNINELVVRAAMNDPVFQTIQEIETALANVVEDD